MNSISSLISVKEFTDILNASTNSHIGNTAIYQMVKTPGFPSVKIGNRYMVMVDKVQDWLESRFAQKTIAEPN